MECDYIWNVFALLQSHIYGLSKIQDAVQNWIDTKESIWKQGSEDQRVPLPLCGLHVCLNIHILNLLFEEEFAMSDIPQNTTFNICAIFIAKNQQQTSKPKTSIKDKCWYSSALQKLIYI